MVPHIGWFLFNFLLRRKKKHKQTNLWRGTEIPIYSGETEAGWSEITGEDCTLIGCRGWGQNLSLGITSCALSLWELLLLLLSNCNQHVEAGGTFRKVIRYLGLMSFLSLLLASWMGDATCSVFYPELWKNNLCSSGNEWALPSSGYHP